MPLDDHGQALGGGQPVDVGPGCAGVSDVHWAGRGVGGKAPGALGQVYIVVVGRGCADVVVADVALALGLDLGVDGDAEGGVAGLCGAGGHLQGEAAVAEQVLLEPQRAAGCAGDVLEGAGGVGADDHDGVGLTGGAGGGELGVGMGRLVVAGGVEHHWEADALAQDGGAEVALADVGEHLRAQVDAVEDSAGAPEGYLVGGGAGDEVVVSLLELLAGEGFVFEDVDGLVRHNCTSCLPLVAAKAVYGEGGEGVKSLGCGLVRRVLGSEGGGSGA